MKFGYQQINAHVVFLVKTTKQYHHSSKKEWNGMRGVSIKVTPVSSSLIHFRLLPLSGYPLHITTQTSCQWSLRRPFTPLCGV
uniref:Ovule protein n=1 Tax=Caenorhabditis tropicalis TaxID=1561998 RepID=A0A1I7TZR6_9PELO